MKIGDLELRLGIPDFLTREDRHEFALGSGRDVANGVVFREIPQHHQWQLAVARYRKGGQLVVGDDRGKGDYRTWSVVPTADEPGAGLVHGVLLHPLHEDGSFFRGARAHAVEPLMLSSSSKAIIAYLTSQDTFNRVSAAAGTGKGWGDMSRWFALFHNFGFIRPTGSPTFYERDDPAVLALKSAKDKEYGLGNKMNYEKTERWLSSLIPQNDEFLKSGLKTVEVEP